METPPARGELIYPQCYPLDSDFGDYGKTCVYFFDRIPVNEETSTSIPMPEQHMVEYQDGEIPDDQLTNEELTEAQTSFEGTNYFH